MLAALLVASVAGAAEEKVWSALILASHVEVDLHEATLLLERGCPLDLALQIVL